MFYKTKQDTVANAEKHTQHQTELRFSCIPEQMMSWADSEKSSLVSP
jgi:hypothetical protein